MIRIHNGETQVLPCVYDEATKTITFETDSFSTYALAYQTSATSGGLTQGGGTSGETAPTTTTPQPTGTQDSNAQGSGAEQKTPLTGDNHRILVYFMLCAVSLLTLVVGKKKEY